MPVGFTNCWAMMETPTLICIDTTCSLKSKVCDFQCLYSFSSLLGILGRKDNFLLRITLLSTFLASYIFPFCLGLISMKSLYAYIHIPLNLFITPILQKTMTQFCKMIGDANISLAKAAVWQMITWSPTTCWESGICWHLLTATSSSSSVSNTLKTYSKIEKKTF